MAPSRDAPGDEARARAPSARGPTLPMPTYGLPASAVASRATPAPNDASARLPRVDDSSSWTRATAETTVETTMDDASVTAPTMTVHRRARRSQRSARTPPRRRWKRFGLSRLRPRRANRPRALTRARAQSSALAVEIASASARASTSARTSQSSDVRLRAYEYESPIWRA